MTAVNSMTHEFTEAFHQTLHKNSNDAPEPHFGDFKRPAPDLEELVHDLRQPLSTIECLTYYLELVCADGQTQSHLHRIQEMVNEANHILERASVRQAN
jgi:hypothetical protein